MLRLSEIWAIRKKFYEEAADLTIETDEWNGIPILEATVLNNTIEDPSFK